MNNRKAPLLNKSYYGGIYLYFKQQKLLKAKETQSNEETTNG
jgi:hypothetical protein